MAHYIIVARVYNDKNHPDKNWFVSENAARDMWTLELRRDMAYEFQDEHMFASVIRRMRMANPGFAVSWAKIDALPHTPVPFHILSLLHMKADDP